MPSYNCSTQVNCCRLNVLLTHLYAAFKEAVAPADGTVKHLIFSLFSHIFKLIFLVFLLDNANIGEYVLYCFYHRLDLNKF